MNDGALLVFGCGVSFLAVAGAYVFLRARYLDSEPIRSDRIDVALPLLATQRVAPAERS